MKGRAIKVIGPFVLVLLAAAGWAAPAQAGEFEKFAIESAAASLSTVQAGEHPDMTLDVSLTATPSGPPYARLRDLEFALPPGISGNPQAVPDCTISQFGVEPEVSECPLDSQVGVTEVTLRNTGTGTLLEPIYNMPSPGGDVVARLGFFASQYPTFINVRIDPVDYGLVATVEGVAAGAGVVAANSTLWGIPGAHSHDKERLTPEEAKNSSSVPVRESTLPPAVFLTNPVDCTRARSVKITARSYQLPAQPSVVTVPFPQIGGCGAVGFAPHFSLVPTNTEAAAPTGIDATLEIPQDENAQARATSTLKSAVVALPEGLTINPAAGDGLEACTAGQAGFGGTTPSACPDAAKIGSVELDVPALEHVLHGSVYQRTPEPGHLFRFWVVTDEQGVHLKLPAEIEVDHATGQLTVNFLGVPSLGGNPQLPFSSFTMHVFGGPRAPLATPASCGTYQTRYSFSPWSGRPAAEGDAPMQITSGCGKGGFAPKLMAGSANSSAGSYSPFNLTVTRQDGESNPSSLEVHLPEGLLAKLGSVPLCPESAAADGGCPGSSQVGSVTAATGVGPAPLWVPQPGKSPTAVYLAGPYKGGPYSLVAKVPAQAGPFDLGTVVNRSAIYVDPTTAEATVKTDPLPQILEGVPIDYRTINVAVDRPEFMLNPTDCDPKQIAAIVTASDGATAAPSTGYQATNCANLGFAPSLKIRLSGATKRAGHPGLKAVVTYPKGAQANIASAQVGLPHSLFLDQGNLNKTCTRPVLLAGNCPKSTVYGHAEAWTPLLAEPLQGPVYLVGGFGYKLPALVAELNGKVRIFLKSKVDTTRQHGIRNTFEAVPDAPVSKFVLQMKGGKKYSLIENSENLCAGPQRVNARFVGQNGAISQQHPKIAVKCRKKRGK